MKIYNCYTNLEKYGGAELIAINLTKGLSNFCNSSELLLFNKLIHHYSYNLNDLKINIFSFSFFLKLQSKDILISHHRKITTLLIILRLLFFKKFRLIHVAHNEFFTLKFASLFPKEIIAVSERVKQNLIHYFQIHPNRITVIYNGISDNFNVISKSESDTIKILYPARITNVKQQVEIVKHLKNKINPNIKIYFAGEGEDQEILIREIEKDSQFHFIGFIDIQKNIQEFDYIMLFSKVEGLPTVFIEACMNSKPIICNNVGGNIEILERGKNGFLANDFSELISVLNNLPNSITNEYKLMSENARIIYDTRFTIDKMISNYVKIITNV